MSVLQETSAEDQLDINALKQLVDANDIFITARDLYQKRGDAETTFQCYAKHIILTNNPLKFSKVADDHGGEDRLESVPFAMRFEPSAKKCIQKQRSGEQCMPADSTFIERLNSELLSQLFSFFVEGARIWYDKGLPKPEAVRVAAVFLIDSNDSVQQFINDCCDTGEGLWEQTASMFSMYGDWFNNEDPDATRLGQQAFSAMLKSKGVKKGRKKVEGENLRVYFGISYVGNSTGDHGDQVLPKLLSK